MTIRWIENVAWEDVRDGTHSDMGPNAMLIQISDPASQYVPIPKKDFKQIYCFEFLDIEDPDVEKDPNMEEFAIHEPQAAALVELLKYAKENHMNVLVHCFAGICRSGAVVEVGSMMGFTPTDRFRQPNLRVKRMMMEALGIDPGTEEEVADRWIAYYDKLESEGKI